MKHSSIPFILMMITMIIIYFVGVPLKTRNGPHIFAIFSLYPSFLRDWMLQGAPTHEKHFLSVFLAGRESREHYRWEKDGESPLRRDFFRVTETWLCWWWAVNGKPQGYYSRVSGKVTTRNLWRKNEQMFARVGTKKLISIHGATRKSKAFSLFILLRSLFSLDRFVSVCVHL